MEWIVTVTARFIRATKRSYQSRWLFLACTVAIFSVSLAFLVYLDLIPDTQHSQANRKNISIPNVSLTTLDTSPLVATSTKTIREVTVNEMPVAIRIPAIHLSKRVLNPSTTNIIKLDRALLSGAVRYPLSASLGYSGNVIIFGHSSYLNIPFDEPYKTFNGIQNLKVGEKILVSSKTTTYVYAVSKVSKEDVKSAAIPLEVAEPTLTLSTCNSFGTKSDRFVVTAHLVDSYPVGS